MSERKYFLGVDGGQTSTTALVADDTGRVLGEGSAGPCNHVAGPERETKFRQTIGSVVREATQSAGLADIRFAGACLGLSGGVADKSALVKEIVPADKVSLVNDAVIALNGATAGEPGVIAIAGTGSIAFGRNAAGTTARAGGWGYVFGDEGGAFDIVRQALRASLREEEGWGPATLLTSMLLEETGAPDMNTLLHWFYRPEYSKARIAGYSTRVDEAARGGDTVAREVLHAAAQSLAVIVAAVRRQLFHRGEAVRFSYIGGVFQSAIVRERFATLIELEGDAPLHPPAFGPAAGALIEAFRLAGLHIHPTHAPAGV